MKLYRNLSIYGEEGTQYVRYVAPGYLSYTAFTFAMFFTVLHFFWERRHGCLERSFTAGLRPIVLIASNLLIFAVLIAVESVVMLVLTLTVFNLTVAGSYGLLLLVLWLTATAGLTFGLLLSSLSPSEPIAIQVSVAVSFLLLSLGGILWPLVSVTKYISWVSQALPVTWAAASFRDIYTRGWTLESTAVYLSVVVPIAWNIVVCLLLLITIRPKKRLCCSRGRNRQGLKM